MPQRFDVLRSLRLPSTICRPPKELLNFHSKSSGKFSVELVIVHVHHSISIVDDVQDLASKGEFLIAIESNRNDFHDTVYTASPQCSVHLGAFSITIPLPWVRWRIRAANQPVCCRCVCLHSHLETLVIPFGAKRANSGRLR